MTPAPQDPLVVRPRSQTRAAGVTLLVSVAAAVAACGGASTDVKPPLTSPEGSAAPRGSAAPPGAAPPPHGTGMITPMKPLIATAMGEDLTKLGLDPKSLPPLSKLDPTTLRQVMKTFSKSLGMPCTGCHDADDFHAPTPKKKIASRMWDLYVRGLTTEDGGPVYCDSCHEGKDEFLDRSDKKALGAWMEANFVGKLRRADKKEHGCETCHGDPFEPKFLAAWAK